MPIPLARTLLAASILAAVAARSADAGAPPPNDDCDQASEITGIPYADSVSTTSATTDAADPAPMCPIGSPNSRGKSVWYVFEATAAATIVADTFESDYDTILSAYTGNCGSLEPIPDACSDDDPLDGAQSRVSFAVSPGVAYRFMVSAFHDDGGGLQFHFAASAANTPTPSVGTPIVSPTPTQPPSLAGDANCDGRKTAPDLTAVIVLIVDGERAECGRDDANGDGVLNIADLVATVTAIFSP